jgi:hypothetical protein
MGFGFKDFETAVGTTILGRARQYWREGRVLRLEEIGEGTWEAQVAGTEDYAVTVVIEDDTIEEHACTCPYDGYVCKHVVATLYAIREQRASAHGPSAAGKGRAPRRADEVEAALSRLSADALTSLARRAARDSREFRSMLLLEDALASGAGEISTYRRIIADFAALTKDRDGYVPYPRTREAIRGAERLRAAADEWIASGDADRAMTVYQAIVEELREVMRSVDDSNGYVSGAISDAIERIATSAQQVTSADRRKEVFEYALQMATDRRFGGWDWAWDFLEMASQLADTRELEDRLIETLSSIAGDREDVLADGDEAEEGEDDLRAGFLQEGALRMILGILDRRGDAAATAQFVRSHLHATSVRRWAVERAFAMGEYDVVRELAEEEIERTPTRPWAVRGGAHEWTNWLLRVAQAESNMEETRRLARDLFLTTGDFRYYDLLKDCTAAAEWVQTRDGLAATLEREGRGFFGGRCIAAAIWAREEKWDRLFNVVMKAPSTMLHEYRDVLEPRYPNELVEYYVSSVRDMLRETTGRRVYEQACALLRRVARLGQSELVGDLIEEFRAGYPTRRALKEELERLYVELFVRPHVAGQD